MKIISVNVGQERNLQVGKRLDKTGIYKMPCLEPVEITPLGLKDDYIFSTKHHGGPDQAVYIYGQADYDFWAQELGQVLLPGTFGENLTISRLESAGFMIGDRLIIGEVTLEVSAPRIPCATLAARMADPLFVKRYRDAERPGLYCRVIRAGFVSAGETVTIQKYLGEQVSILEIYRGYYEKDQGEAAIRRQMQAPVAVRVRLELEEKLRKLEIPGKRCRATRGFRGGV